MFLGYLPHDILLVVVAGVSATWIFVSCSRLRIFYTNLC
jgi:hypothetical protein